MKIKEIIKSVTNVDPEVTNTRKRLLVAYAITSATNNQNSKRIDDKFFGEVPEVERR